MRSNSLLLTSAAIFTLIGCGGSKGGTEAAGSVSKENVKAASLTAPSPLDTKFTLKDGEPLDITGLLSLMPEDSRPSYESVDFDASLGATVISNLKFVDPADGEEISIERIELFGVDTDAMERVNTTEDAGVDAPFETIFQKVRMFGIAPEGESDGSDLSIGAIEFDRLRIRQGGIDNDADNPAFLFNAFELGGLYIKDLVVDAESLEAEGAANAIKFEVPDFRIVEVGGGKLGALIMNDLEYGLDQSDETIASLTGLLGEQGALIMNSPLRNFLAPGSQRGSMKSFVWRGLDLSGLLEYGLKGERPPYSAKNLVQLGSFEAKETEAYINGELAYKNDVSSMTSTESTWVIPTKLRSSSKGDVYNFAAYVPEEEEAIRKIISDNGLDKVTASSDFAWDWDSEKGSAALSSNIDTDGFANFSMGFDLDGFEIEKIATALDAGDENAVAALGVFNNFSIKLEDEKLLDVIFDIAGLQMGASGADLRQSAPAMVRLSGIQVAQLNPRIPDYVDAFASFLEEGGSIEISADPSSPVPLADLAATGETSPQSLPDVINLAVTHKK